MTTRLIDQETKLTVVSVDPMPTKFCWYCDHCEQRGEGFVSETAAVKEAARHSWEEHGIAICYPGWYGGPHDWKHVLGTDSIDQCTRCNWDIGK